jgi:3-oxoacyl-(acyl-carrier-protein) synthase
MELAASLVGMNAGEIPMTLNYEQPDQECPINVVHGEPLTSNKRAALKLSSSRLGHAAAMIIAAE